METNMILRTVLLMLLGISGSAGSLYCEFNNGICDWKNNTYCSWKLIADEPLYADTGYLRLDETCPGGEISHDLLNEEGPFKFRVKYLLGGPGRVRLSVMGEFTLSNRELWSTTNEDVGREHTGWQYQDIVAYHGEIDFLDSISIVAYIDGSGTVAIGSISKIESFTNTDSNIVDNSTQAYSEPPNGSTQAYSEPPNDSTQAYSEQPNNSTEAPGQSKMHRISIYLIVAALGLVIVIILSVSVFCFVRN